MDIVDIANDYAERELAERLYSRVKYVGESLSECEDCGEEIPVARRSIILAFVNAGTALNGLSGGLCNERENSLLLVLRRVRARPQGSHQRPIGAYLRCVRRAVRGPARGQGALAASCLQF